MKLMLLNPFFHMSFIETRVKYPITSTDLSSFIIISSIRIAILGSIPHSQTHQNYDVKS